MKFNNACEVQKKTATEQFLLKYSVGKSDFDKFVSVLRNKRFFQRISAHMTKKKKTIFVLSTLF